jgi:4-alpha-glucanotransferase
MRFPRTSGVLLHPTSLPGRTARRPRAVGLPLRRLARRRRQRLWQILPLGSIGAGNSPYMSTSAFAGNVLLIDLADLQAHGWLDAPTCVPPGFSAPRIDFAAMVP